MGTIRRKGMNIYVFKVALFYAKRIYRRIAIREDQTLNDLHQAIYEAFDRYYEHLYSFYFPFRPTQSKHIIRQSPQVTHPQHYRHTHGDSGFDNDIGDASKKSIASLSLVPKQKFYYLFDFGDKWWHEITFEKIVENDGGEYPRILMKKGESPPQYPEDEDGYE
jgi:hypothetical protein